MFVSVPELMFKKSDFGAFSGSMQAATVQPNKDSWKYPESVDLMRTPRL